MPDAKPGENFNDGVAPSGSYIIIVLASLAMFINAYALTNLFPYVCI